MVSFESDNNNMLAKLNNLGKLVHKVSGIDYRSKKQPLVSVCEKGKGMEQLYKLRGVSVDKKTGNIMFPTLRITLLKYLIVQVSICSNLETMKEKE